MLVHYIYMIIGSVSYISYIDAERSYAGPIQELTEGARRFLQEFIHTSAGTAMLLPVLIYMCSRGVRGMLPWI